MANEYLNRWHENNPTPDITDELYRFVTSERQKDVLDACCEFDSFGAVGRALGVNAETCYKHYKRVARAAARAGVSPGVPSRAVADGFAVKGRTVALDADGNITKQWVKSSPEEDARFEALEDAVASLTEPLRDVHVPRPYEYADAVETDTLCVYPMGDPHIGMYAWVDECGHDFDCDIAEDNLMRAVLRLVDQQPFTTEALLVNLGDFFHTDTLSNTTRRSGAHLDVDSRWPRVLRVGIRIMVFTIEALLEKHRTVRVINEIGNHDDQSSIMLGLCIAAYFKDNSRVVVDTSPMNFHWHRFGRNLFGVTHGDGAKLTALPGIMATDRPKDWGETDYRHWLVGHVHHDQRLVLKEYPGVTVETFRTLAPKDEWHTKSGYRSLQDMKCIRYHRKYGEVGRSTVSIREVWGLGGKGEPGE